MISNRHRTLAAFAPVACLLALLLFRIPGWFWVFFGAPLFLICFFWFGVVYLKLTNRSDGNPLPMLFILTFGVLSVLGAYWKFREKSPPGVTYEYQYGDTGSWQAVQFYEQVDGERIKGPWAGGWPVDVRYKDLNGDGHTDIRVIGEGERLAEFQRVVPPRGKIRWELVTQHELQAEYYPATN